MGFFSFFTAPKIKNLPELRVRNTLSGELEAFEPINGTVRMYNCGPTVYDRQHIGNLRPYVFADVLRRTLESWGYKVSQVINITDVGHLVSDADEGEDKMEKSAKARGKHAQDIAKEVTEWWFEDLDAIGVDRRRIQFPRATEYIGEQIALVKALMQKGYAYQIADGVYFDTAKFSGYGKLGGVSLSGQVAGARVEENKDKKSPHDFALWKFSKAGEQREQEWESPWGKGFPGWHLECTAMIFKLLGKQIDIHTGGVDHIPVHHNNEIAQAESVTGKQYVRYWMHNEFITIEGKKVSKSLGNTIYLSQLVDRGLSARSLRYLYLTAHYRSPMNFTWESIEGADQAFKRLTRSYLEMPKGGTADEGFLKDFYAALANDLDTPAALARVWELMKDQNVSPADKKASLAEADKVLGLGLAAARPQSKLAVKQEIPEEVVKLLSERETARQNKDFAKADELRGQIEAAGFELKDTPEGPVVSKK
jgi:cysteinyl-tRNA synthetase